MSANDNNTQNTTTAEKPTAQAISLPPKPQEKPLDKVKAQTEKKRQKERER